MKGLEDVAVELDQPIWGVAAIAAVIQRNQRQTYYLLGAGHLPAEKVGRTWVSTRRRLLGRVCGTP